MPRVRQVSAGTLHTPLCLHVSLLWLPLCLSPLVVHTSDAMCEKGTGCRGLTDVAALHLASVQGAAGGARRRAGGGGAG